MTDKPTERSEKIEKKPASRKTTWLAVGLSLLSGLFFFLAFPPVNFWPLIWVAATPYLVAQYRFMPYKWSALAPTLAIGIWLWPFLYRIFGIPDAPFLFKHMGLLIALITFLTSKDRKFHELTGFRWFVLQGITAWVGFEMIRSFIPVLGTMGFVANPLAGQAWLIQPVSIFSIYGLNLLIILFNFTLAQVIMHWIDRKWTLDQTIPVDGRASGRWVRVLGLAVVAWVTLSLVIYNQKPADAGTIRVAALQMNLEVPGFQQDDAGQAERLQLLTEQVYEASGQGAQVVYVPEMAFGFDPQKKFTEELRALTAETNTYIYFSYAYFEDAGWHNETVLINPNGEFSPIYGKQHAFGEPPTISAGTSPVNQTPLGDLGAVICMDAVFTGSARENIRNGAQILAIPTYNTTIGISEQNWTHFVFRSVENQVPVVNADRGYYSMITDPHGRILADVRTPQGESAVLVADVPLAGGRSLYTSVGDWVGWICLAGFIFFMFFKGVLEKRARKAVTH